MISEKINEMIMNAMKARDVVGIQVCKLIKAEFLKAEKEKGFSGWDEASEVKILMKMRAQRKDSISAYVAVNRMELAEEEQKELDYLNDLIPKHPTDEEVVTYTQEVIDSMKANGDVISMKIMKTILAKVREKYSTANGKIVSKIVKENM